MNRWRPGVEASVVGIWMALAGCAVTPPISTDAPGRFYNLETAQVISAMLYGFSGRHGAMSAQVPGGETFKGEFSLSAGFGTEGFDRMRWAAARAQPPGEDAEKKPAESTARPTLSDKSWPEIYGFNWLAPASPAGTASLVGDKGTLMDIVLFHVDVFEGFADGVAKDNRGNWYRVYVGELPERAN